MVVLFDIFTDPDDISEHRFFIVDIGDMSLDDADEAIYSIYKEFKEKGVDLSYYSYDLLIDEFCRRYNAREIDFEGIDVFLT